MSSVFDDFIAWYCSEPRLAFSRTVVLRYRLELESRRLASSINLRLAAVRRLAYESADTGLLSPELAAGIRRVKGVKRIGVRLGNWLTAEQSRAEPCSGLPTPSDLKGRRDRAILALMLGCGLRRGEVASLRIDHRQQREEHWVIADLIGQAAHIFTVPVPDWVKSAIDEWVVSAAITAGRLFRCVSRKESVWGAGITEKVIWHVVKAAAAIAELPSSRPTIVAVPAPVYAAPPVENWSRSNSCWGTFQWRLPNATWDASSGSEAP
jgi:site-specific recombinase XerC